MLPDLQVWLKGRRPEAPGDLALEVGGSARRAEGRDVSFRALGVAAVTRLAAACARPGRIRESAFDLLVADALVTYACEAALESDDVEAALLDLMSVGGSSDPEG